MKSIQHHFLQYSKRQRWAVGVLLLLILLLEIGNFVFSRRNENEKKIIVPKEILAFSSETKSNSKSKYPQIELKDFDPNELSEMEWQNLGFSEKQVQTILKYKYSLGGNFTNKEQIRNCFVISAKKFREIEPYIKIGKIVLTKNSQDKNQYFEKSKPKIKYSYFDPNQYSQKDWINIGFSEKQAATILKYKRSLGGEFKTLNEIKKCFIISDEKFEEMRPFMHISPKKQTTEIKKTQTPKLEKFNPNHLTREEWMDLGFSEKQVNTIFNYKRSLGGNFKDAETLKKCYSISDEKFKEIEPYLDFNLD